MSRAATEHLDTIRRMCGTGRTDREIAEETGLTIKQVEHARRDFGIAKQRSAREAVQAVTVSDRLRARLGGEPKLSPSNGGKPIANGPLEPVLIVPDAHIPYHAPAWWDLLMQVGRAIKPQHIVIIGDFADCYAISAHDKSRDRAGKLDWELGEVEKHLDELESLGARDLLYIEGNHEDRIRRAVMRHPEFGGLVSTEKLLDLKRRGWEFVPYKRHAKRGSIHYTHDVNASGRNAVFRAIDVYQASVVTGHTHRLQYIVEGTATGECKVSAMFGWGGDVEQIDYMNLAKARKDWALGLGVGYSDPSSGFCYLVPVPVVHGTCCVNGVLYRAAA